MKVKDLIKLLNDGTLRHNWSPVGARGVGTAALPDLGSGSRQEAK